MGEFVPAHSYAKGPIFYALDTMSVRPDARALLGRLEDALKDKASSDFDELDETFAQYLYAPLKLSAALTPAALSHLKRTWYDASSKDNYFHEHQPIGPIIGMGFLKTLKISLRGTGAPLPIDSWWIMDHSKFEVLTLVSNHQVTMLVCTPRPRGPVPTGIWGTTAEAYTTGRLGVVTRRFPN
jgi:hypothetical protein